MITYPDVSHFQTPLSLAGAVACFAKATEGSDFVDQSYAGFRTQATHLGAVFGAYHYVNNTGIESQAQHAHGVVGATPLMWDAEAAGATVARLLALTSAYRALHGIVHLVYLPRWWWSTLGAPDLRPLADAGLALVASRYGEGPNSASGWASYGGMTPSVLQYTDAQMFNGKRVDFNAYRGTLDQFRALITGQDASEMTSLTPSDEQALIWRVKTVLDNATVVAGGPTKDEANLLASALAGIRAAVMAIPHATLTLTDAQMAQLISALPTPAEIATAVCDEADRRTRIRLDH